MLLPCNEWWKIDRLENQQGGSMKPYQLTENVYLIGGPDITDSNDCLIYLLDLGELVMIDAGAGKSLERVLQNINILGLSPGNLSAAVLTHCHIDHVGGARELRRKFNIKLIMHDLDAATVERGDIVATGASWYGLPFSPLPVDIKLTDAKKTLQFASGEIICIHTPGHTPGSLSLYTDIRDQRILFGQEIHGPFLKEFGADMSQWRNSMQQLLALNADILCEGHFGVFKPASGVREYIERYLEEYGE